MIKTLFKFDNRDKIGVMMGDKRTILILLILLSSLLIAFPESCISYSHGTFIIRADGTVFPSSAPIQRDGNVYTLTGDLTADSETDDGLTIERDNIILDGAGYTLQGSEDQTGINLPPLNPDEPGRSNVIIKNIRVEGFHDGINLWNSTNNTVTGCTTNSIKLFGSNDNTITENNIGTIELIASSKQNSIIGNNIANSRYGIKIEWSPNNIFRENSIVNCTYPLTVDTAITTNEDWIQFIDTSNTIDGKPIHYVINKNDLTFGPTDFPEIGYLAFVNCTRITVENLNVVDVLQGIILAQTTNSTITNNTIDKNWYGIYLLRSFDNTIIENIVTNNSYGIYLNGPSNNTIMGNNITANNDGIRFEGGSHNTIIGNTLTNNKRGIYLNVSPNNTIVGNQIQDNEVGIEFWSLYTISSDNLIYSNNIISNNKQVVFSYVMYGAGASNIWEKDEIGNYWSDYSEQDNDGDGVGDTPYIIDENNQDNYPLMEPVDISAIPEFPTWITIPLFLMATLAIIIYRKKLTQKKHPS